MNSPPELVTCYAGCGQQYDARDRAACHYHQAHADSFGPVLARMGRRRRRLAAMAKDRHRLLTILDRLQADRDDAVRGWHQADGKQTRPWVPDEVFLSLWRPDR